MNWVSVENQAFYSTYTITVDEEQYPSENIEMADSSKAFFTEGSAN